ncbi:amino acid aminotransferase [Gynuella sunshinyii]|uniref:Aminotransferase n=1 Tax=Gynuella sunshinyii YC6258 TaxID=1445510 RepID=A0A0C5VKU9_9GAMM|nr:amino acid aminotransferase [Gynuella sunshinyii]AJQ95292.1 aspartate/tyrosine/aromatic aminotransferase [Gynuella sunshinyii YC6258]
MFESISLAPADPILGLTDAFKSDSREKKVNLGVGVFKDEEGNTPILNSVKEAEKLMLETEKTKGYLSISGIEEYGRHVQQLLFGDSDIVSSGRAVTAQAPGGTGALRVGADFLVKQGGACKVWISNPTWANHNAIFTAAGFEVAQYRYYNSETRSLDFDGMLEDLQQVAAGDVVLLHGCCHNPTGIDPSIEQWRQLAGVAVQKGWLPFFDFAYQGFARGVEEDAGGLRAFAEQVDELVISSSFSKNFGLYNERVGAVTLVAKEAQAATNAFSQIKVIIRSNYSNPPAHGALVVTTVLSNPALKSQWVGEVAMMRNRIREMRELFVAKLSEKGVQRDFSFINQQNGMFSFSGLSKEQVESLKKDFGIYMVGSGRINVAGMTKSNLDYLCESIASVL